uniref:Peptidase A2 domain-containing protein n=1 Tax=Strongyloides papillosus TaxID=174720 RepID=A0A0N5BZH2_STREA
MGQLKMYESVDQDIEQSLRALWSTGNYKAAEKLIDKMIGNIEKDSSKADRLATPEVKSAVNDNTLLRTLTPFEGNDVTEFKRWVETYDLAVSLAHQTLPNEQKEKLRCIYLASYLKGRAGQLRKDAYARMVDITFERLIGYIENNLPVPISIERTGRMRRVYFKNMTDDFEEHCNTFLEGTKAATGVSIDMLAGRSPGTMEPLQQLTRIDFINSFPFYIREHLEQMAFTSSLWEIKDAAFELVLRERNKLTRRNMKVSSPTRERKNQQSNEDKRQERRQAPGYFKSRRIVNVVNPQQPEDINHPSEVEDPVELNFAGPIVPTVSSKSWNIAAPHRINCNNLQMWHLESRYVFRRTENNCTKTLELLAVSNNFILLIKDNPTLLYKTKENNQKCNVSAYTLSKGYLTNFVDNIWQFSTIPQEVADDQIRLPEDMDESLKGIAIQLLLFKAGILVRQLDKTQWDALFINIFNAHYKEVHKRHIFRTITFTLVQQLVTPLYNTAYVRLQKEFMDISKTIDPTEKMRIFLEREDIRASYHQGRYKIQTCTKVKPTSIFTDYRYQNMCYTFMPAIVNKSLKFVDQNNYLHEHSQGSPCVTLAKQEIQKIQETQRSDEGILESLGETVNMFERAVQVLELSLIHGIIVILGILACRMSERGNRQRRRLLGRMSDMVEMRLMRPTVSVAVTQIGKQPMVDLYVHQEGQTKIARYLIDTGACVSFIRKKCVKHNTSLSLFTQPMTVATDFNNQPIKAIGKTSILFVFGRKKYVKVDIWVVDDLRYDILIGSDVLEDMDWNNLSVTFKLAANSIQIGTIRYPLVRKASVAYLQPYEVWKTMRSWISLLQPPSVIQFQEDKDPEILDLSTLDLPEEALADFGIWEQLPKESTLATINWNGTALSGRGRAKVALLIQKWSEAFIKHEDDIGRYKGPIAHIIKLKPDAKLPYTGLEDKNPEILDLSTLDLPEEAMADFGIWEPLPKESTLATINWKGTALSGRGRAKVALIIQKWSEAKSSIANSKVVRGIHKT